MSTEKPKDSKERKRKKPRRNDTPSAAPTRQEKSSLPDPDDKPSNSGKQTSECTCKCHSEPKCCSAPQAGTQANRRLEGINNDDYCIDIVEVERRTGLGKSTIHYLMNNSDFPLPLQMGERATRWWSNEVDLWILTRKRAKGDLGKRHSKLECKT